MIIESGATSIITEHRIENRPVSFHFQDGAQRGITKLDYCHSFMYWLQIPPFCPIYFQNIHSINDQSFIPPTQIYFPS